MNRSKRLLLILLVVAYTCQGQNTIGLPEIINYSKHIYGGGTQNWDIQQDVNGIMYFANNEGMLSFDGTHWRIYPLPNKTIVRSIAIGRDRRIYAGGQDEIGYFSPDSTGTLRYTSLKHLIPDKERSFADIWDIIPYGSDVFFRSIHKILQYTNKTIIAYPAVSEWAFMGLHQQQLVAQDMSHGLLYFHQGTWQPLLPTDELQKGLYTSALISIGKDSSLMATLKDGVFLLANGRLSRFTSPDIDRIARETIYGGLALGRNWFALSTSLGGCHIFNREGELIQSFSRKEGLQNNNITSIFRDRNNNLWLGLDNGIDFVAYDNAIKHIYPENLNEGSGYAALIHQDHLYLGTTNGLYTVPLTAMDDLSFVKGQFTAVPNTKGQVWGLSGINGQVLMGHHDGCYQVLPSGAIPVNARPGWGYWTYLPVSKVLPSAQVLAGTYHGLDILAFSNGSFKPVQTIAGLEEPARFITFDNNNVAWASHPYRGVYRVDLSVQPARIKLYTDKEGLPSFMNNHVYNIRNQVVVATERGVYVYNDKSDRFVAAEAYLQVFGNTSLRYLKEDSEGNIWFIHDKQLGVVDYAGTSPQIVYLPELNGKMVSGFEHIYTVNARNIFMGGETGFYHINYDQYRRNKYVLQAHINSVSTSGSVDRQIFGGYFGEVNDASEQDKEVYPDIPWKWNSLHFEYSSTLYGQQANITYSYQLKGFDAGWSEWSRKTEKDYTNLSPGNYVFEVKARNNLGNESVITSYHFRVMPPWYQSWWAYGVYTLALFGLALVLYKRQQKKFQRQQQRHEEEQRRLLYLHQLELEKSEKEIVKLRNEKLESEIDHKNKELASSAMHLVQKGELIGRIKEELTKLKKLPTQGEEADELKKLLRILHEEDKVDQGWEQFAFHFDRVHSDFLVALKERYPLLTANEIKLCAYLRMNLSTKEIAQLMNISVRGVEISRYRLRKKLQIATETNLFQFLLNIKSTNHQSH
ncbi:triple tyrosine motif-containing protein [Paraflavitalea sp. CAU 1676]|uniref:ligand-binding sensor domain-containing protein n=1 Tax=Paraflavitalea sp. CAU 1676 TaxID=3032598 RepID=UPI0023DB487D|nr:triple tyrosine motif-containing protein [Paraflavitalea sp. CAU 1676]MDF2188025.1 triple tyrosine motif-containing protein [Paraflavitalea sp. CAU 1676]